LQAGEQALRVLVVKLTSLGDVVHTLPAVMDIKAQFPNAQIDWVVEKSFAPLVHICPVVNTVIETDIRSWRRALFAKQTRLEFARFKKKLQSTRYDAVIDLQGLSKSAFVCALTKLSERGRRYAMANQTNGASYEFATRWVAHTAFKIHPQVHAVERARILCSKALGYPYPFNPVLDKTAAPPTLAVSPSEAVAPNTIAFVHATSRADKTWSLKNWTELGEALIARGFQIALPQGSDAELEQARQIANTLVGAKVWTKMSLSEVSSHLRACVGVIGVDSGLSHIAEVLDLPLVQIYNFDTNWRTGPQRWPFQKSIFELPCPSVEHVLELWDSCLKSYELSRPTEYAKNSEPSAGQPDESLKNALTKPAPLKPKRAPRAKTARTPKDTAVPGEAITPTKLDTATAPPTHDATTESAVLVAPAEPITPLPTVNVPKTQGEVASSDPLKSAVKKTSQKKRVKMAEDASATSPVSNSPSPQLGLFD
jgi:heptosyltransferase-1